MTTPKKYKERKNTVIKALGSECKNCGSKKTLYIMPKTTKGITFSKLWSMDNFLEAVQICFLLCQKCKNKMQAKPIKHGTYWAYKYHKCKCDSCRIANTEKLKTYKNKNKKCGNKICHHCKVNFCYNKFCSSSCANKHNSQDPTIKQKISASMTKRVLDGKTRSYAVRCGFPFKGEIIRCDSLLELCCLEYFVMNHNVAYIDRCKFSLPYDDNGNIRSYVPDFIIYTENKRYIVECKSKVIGSLNIKWRSYNERAVLKKLVLDGYASENQLTSFWFTPKTGNTFYKKNYNKLRNKYLEYLPI